MKVLIINGPNLNLTGSREKSIYGEMTFDHFFSSLKASYPDVILEYFQSNHEGAIIDKIHSAGFDCDGIILNAGAYTHTSIAIADAIRAVKLIAGKLADAVLEGRQGEQMNDEEPAAEAQAADAE